MTTGAATPEASKRVRENYEQYKYFFRMEPINAHFLGVNMVDFVEAKAADLGWESVAVLVEDYEWTKPVSAVLDEQLGDTGVEIGLSTRYASGTENFSPIYDQVESAGVDAASSGWRIREPPPSFSGRNNNGPSTSAASTSRCNCRRTTRR